MADKVYGDAGKKMPGWYSWRHKTNEENRAAREAYKWNRGRDARRRRAAEREAARKEAS